MQIEIISDIIKSTPSLIEKSLIEKSTTLIHSLFKSLLELEIHRKSYKIILDDNLFALIPPEQQDLFIERLRSTTNTKITAFHYKEEEIEMVCIGLCLIKIDRGYSTSVVQLGDYMFKITQEKSIFLRLE